MKISRLKISKGEDKRITFFFKNANSLRPVNLEEATNIQFVFERSDRQSSILDMVQIPATKASFAYNGGKFTADTAGSQGNSIILQFDGVKTIDAVVTEWNDANTGNTVGYTGIIGSFVPVSGNIRLADGLNAYVPVEILNAVIGEVSLTIEDRISNSLKIGDNQSFKVIIDFGAAPQGTRRKARISNILDVSV